MGMARVVIIGASKGIGLETTRQALEAGHMVRAFARSAADISISDPKLEKVRGNALRSNDVTAAVKGTNAVIQALGVGLGDLFGPVHEKGRPASDALSAENAGSPPLQLCESKPQAAVELPARDLPFFQIGIVVRPHHALKTLVGVEQLAVILRDLARGFDQMLHEAHFVECHL
jgi:NAD(P)-dependent dehydrogenase (short-subunit alcohol dehydrogenase family)